MATACGAHHATPRSPGGDRVSARGTTPIRPLAACRAKIPANQEDRTLTTTAKPARDVRQKIENWVGDFCQSDALKNAAPDAPHALRSETQEVLTHFLFAACANEGRAPGELEQEDLSVAFLESVAPQDLDPDLHAILPDVIAGLLAHMEAEGRLSGGRDKGATLKAMRDKYTEVASAKLVPIKNTATKLKRNDPCPCGSGKKYKKCCINKG